MTYKPTHDDLDWMLLVLSMMEENGVVVFPSTGLIYRISHRHKTITLQNPAVLSNQACREVHERTVVVVAFFDYTMREATQ